MYSSLRILAIHAHPDDETLYTGGTLAYYAARGATVQVVTCTLGEEGEVIGDEFSTLVAADGGADQLGGYRIHELTEAYRALGIDRPHFLGTPGCYRDSGMAGSPSHDHPRAFVRKDQSEIAEQMACWIRRLRPHCVLLYDEGGTYGHPDHIHAQACGMTAVHYAADHGDRDERTVEASGVLAGYTGARRDDYARCAPAWETPRVYRMMQSRERLAEGLRALDGKCPEQWSIPSPEELFCTGDQQIDTVMTLDDDAYARKKAALRAHATQVSVSFPADGPDAFAMSNNIAQPLLRTEEFALALNRVNNSVSTCTDIAAGLLGLD